MLDLIPKDIAQGRQFIRKPEFPNKADLNCGDVFICLQLWLYHATQ